MKHPEHHFVVKRLFANGWGNLTDDATTFENAVDAIIEGFDEKTVTAIDYPSAETVLVLEIDGTVAINRTEDVIAAAADRLKADYNDGMIDDVTTGWADLVRVAE